MIGVAARDEERDSVCEFFELFKTPWEFCRGNDPYEVVIRTDGAIDDRSSKLVIVYGSQPPPLAGKMKECRRAQDHDTTLSWNGERIPVYGSCVAFSPGPGCPDLVVEATGEPVVSVTRTDGRTVVSVGYDLFREVRFLLTEGQPPTHAGIPTLERHIAFLRDLIVGQ